MHAGDEGEIARMRTVMFQARLAAGDTDVRVEELDAVEDYAVRHAERWCRGWCTTTAASPHSRPGTSPRRRPLRAGTSGVRGERRPVGIVNATDILGHSLAAVGDYEGAMRAYEQALGAGVRDLREEAVPLLYHYGLSRLRAGDAEAAATLFEECQGLSERESSFLCWHSTMGAAHLARMRGDSASAAVACTTRPSRSCARSSPRVSDNPPLRSRWWSRLRELGSLAERGAAGRAEPMQRRASRWPRRRATAARAHARGTRRALSLGERRREAARLLGVAEAIRAEVGASSRTPRGSTSIGCRAACATVWETGRSPSSSTGAGRTTPRSTSKHSPSRT